MARSRGDGEGRPLYIKAERRLCHSEKHAAQVRYTKEAQAVDALPRKFTAKMGQSKATRLSGNTEEYRRGRRRSLVPTQSKQSCYSWWLGVLHQSQDVPMSPRGLVLWLCSAITSG